MKQDVLSFINKFNDEDGCEDIEYDSYAAKSDTTGRTGEVYDFTFNDAYSFCLFREDTPEGGINDRLITVDINGIRVYTDGDEDVEFSDKCIEFLLEVIGLL